MFDIILDMMLLVLGTSLLAVGYGWDTAIAVLAFASYLKVKP